MKKLKLIQLSVILFIALLSACSTPKYFGKTYATTQNVDVYLETDDVKKSYTTMGTSEYEQDFKSIETMQQKLIEMGKAKGADGVIMKLTDEKVATQQSGGGVISTNKKNSTISTSSTTIDVKNKKLSATFIKYN